MLISFEITTQIVIIELGQNYSHSILLHSSRTDKVQNGNNPHFVLGPYGSHVTPIYIACFPLIIRMGQDNVSFSVPSQANNRMFKNRHSVVNLFPNSEIYEFSREQGEAYMACVILFIIHITCSLLVFKQKLHQQKVVKQLLTAICKFCIIFKYTDMTNITVERHCLICFVSFTKFSGGTQVCTAVSPVQIITSDDSYAKQLTSMLKHRLSQRIFSEKFRLTLKLSPDIPVKGNSRFSVYPDKNCAVSQANTLPSVKYYVLNLDWNFMKSIKEYTNFLIPINKYETTIQLASRMIFETLLESCKINDGLIFVSQLSDEYLNYPDMLNSLMLCDQPLSGQMVSHDDLIDRLPTLPILGQNSTTSWDDFWCLVYSDMFLHCPMLLGQFISDLLSHVDYMVRPPIQLDDCQSVSSTNNSSSNTISGLSHVVTFFILVLVLSKSLSLQNIELCNFINFSILIHSNSDKMFHFNTLGICQSGGRLVGYNYETSDGWRMFYDVLKPYQLYNVITVLTMVSHDTFFSCSHISCLTLSGNIHHPT